MSHGVDDLLRNLADRCPPDRPVLIAGPTAAGKSALALAVAERQGRVIFNADALQVWDCWRLLSARPSQADEARATHLLFGHMKRGADYSVGHWLREVAALLPRHPAPVIVGGTGLFLSALTTGLADIPPTPSEIRAEADARMVSEGSAPMLAELDTATASRIDTRNPIRIQRAWEVLRTTGRGLAGWQDGTGAPLLPLSRVTALRIEADRDVLALRIDARFDAMLAGGALDEARAVLPDWSPRALWAKAIGAPELVAHLQGETDLATATERAKAASRQYAKRQRTWFRARMGGWTPVTVA
jgi:tRNA dimethylallyltransferase